MNSGQSHVHDTNRPTAPLPDPQNSAPRGPQPTSRWECPARYVTNHKHEDGRPLCRYGECWNPAPFPNGSLPILPQRHTTIHLPSTLNPNSDSPSIQLPMSQPSFPPDIPSPTVYSGYNLPPASESHPSQLSVCDPVLAPWPDTPTYHHLLQQLSFPSTAQNAKNSLSRFPSLKNNSSIVEPTQLPLKPRPKLRIPHPTTHSPINDIATFPTSKQKPGSHSLSSKQRSLPEVLTDQVPQWQLQIICGPGHNHNDFESQRPGIKFQAFELIGE